MGYTVCMKPTVWNICSSNHILVVISLAAPWWSTLCLSLEYYHMVTGQTNYDTSEQQVLAAQWWETHLPSNHSKTGVNVTLPLKDLAYLNMFRVDIAHSFAQDVHNRHRLINSSLPGQNGCRFADAIFRFFFVNGKFCILIKISLKFVPKGSIDNLPTLVQIMA